MFSLRNKKKLSLNYPQYPSYLELWYLLPLLHPHSLFHESFTFCYRVASMQDAADKEKKPSIIEEQIRNLRKSSKDGKLWLVDNESGLFDAYDLISKNYDPVTSRFTAFHDQMLQTTCIFQASVIRALEKLYRAPSPHERLINYALSFEPLIQQLPKDIRYKRFTQMFVTRIENVLNWVKKCKSYSYKDR